MLQKNPSKLFGQPDINKVFGKHKEKEGACAWRMRSIRESFMGEEKGDGVTARTLQAGGWMSEHACWERPGHGVYAAPSSSGDQTHGGRTVGGRQGK